MEVQDNNSPRVQCLTEAWTYFLVVVRFPLMMRVEVDIDLKLLIPGPPRPSELHDPMEEKEVKSAGGRRTGRL